MDKKVMVITGAMGGIGATCANHFLDKGWTVIGIIRDRKQNLNSSHENYYSLPADIRDSKQVHFVFDFIKERFSKIDVLVNNASVFQSKPFAESSMEDIDNIMDTNVKGSLYCTLEAIKILKGRIINIGSVSGLNGIKDQAIYSASKFAINGFSESIAQESGTKITTINCGGVDTPLWNEKNPYKGDISKLLKPMDVVKIIDYIVSLPENVTLKNITVFPNNEWH